MKSFVAPEETVCKPINCLQWCQSVAYFTSCIVWNKVISLVLRDWFGSFVFKLSMTSPTVLKECSAFQTRWLHYPQCNLATERHHWRIHFRLHSSSSDSSCAVNKGRDDRKLPWLPAAQPTATGHPAAHNNNVAVLIYISLLFLLSDNVSDIAAAHKHYLFTNNQSQAAALPWWSHTG